MLFGITRMFAHAPRSALWRARHRRQARSASRVWPLAPVPHFAPAIVEAMAQLHLWLIVQCMILLAIANGTPVIAKKILGKWLAWPVDGGWLFFDGRPLLGRSKTFRGVILAIVGSAIGGYLAGLGTGIGALIGLNAMAGDMLASFFKRRLGLAPSAEAPGLDQVPESLLPLLTVKSLVGLSVLDILIGVGVFWAGELAVSRILYILRIRDRPY